MAMEPPMVKELSVRTMASLIIHKPYQHAGSERYVSFKSPTTHLKI